MIPKIFHLFWSGGPISFMRYATFVTLRHHHPNWTIVLHTAKKFTKNNWAKEGISQDFVKTGIKDYSEQVYATVNETRSYALHADKPPTAQSDFLRWDVLDEEGGFYLDTDQVVLHPFDDLCSHSFVYSNCNNYVPVGVLGSFPKLGLTHHIRIALFNSYNPDDYNSSGPTMMMKMVKTLPHEFSNTGVFNSERLFYPTYPWEASFKGIYDGTLMIPESAYALHWFGGHHMSQAFNLTYNEQLAEISMDWISRTLRGMRK